jgi:hypothetical protein
MQIEIAGFLAILLSISRTLGIFLGAYMRFFLLEERWWHAFLMRSIGLFKQG